MKWKFWKTETVFSPELLASISHTRSLGNTLLQAIAVSRAMRGEKMTYLDHLESVAEADVACLREAEKHYGDSWKKRGGVGAFMMLARKWDRIEKQVSQTRLADHGDFPTCMPYDIFDHVREDTRPEGIIDDIRDLRRYLLLVEAELAATGSLPVADELRSDEEHPFGYEGNADATPTV